MICWHDWDVKDKQQRIFIRRLYGLGGKWLWGFGLIVVYVCYFQFSEALDFSSAVTIMLTICALFLSTIIYTGLTFVCLGVLDDMTRWKDKICHKCHLAVLDVSKHKKEIEIYEEEQKYLSENIERQNKNIQNATDESFSYQKARWQEEQGK